MASFVLVLLVAIVLQFVSLVAIGVAIVIVTISSVTIASFAVVYVSLTDEQCSRGGSENYPNSFM